MSNQPGQLFVISAPSGAGKTSLVKALVEQLTEQGKPPVFSVSFTTRKPRIHEEDGVDYHFVSVDEFRQLIADDALLEHAEVFGNFYGTGRAQVDAQLQAGQDVILEIDWQGAQQVRQRASDCIGIFIKPPSLQELERRLRGRASDSEAVIAGRLKEAEADISHAGEFQHQIVNDDFDQALAEMVQIFQQA